MIDREVTVMKYSLIVLLIVPSTIAQATSLKYRNIFLGDSSNNAVDELLDNYLPGFSSSVQGTGISGLDSASSPSGKVNWFLYNKPSSFDGNQTLRVDRNIPTGSGTSGNVYNDIWANCTTNPGNAGFEWCLNGQITNNASTISTAQNIATAGNAFKTLTGVPTYATTGTSGTGSSCTVTMSETPNRSFNV
jgi:hypothetical protein